MRLETRGGGDCAILLYGFQKIILTKTVTRESLEMGGSCVRRWAVRTATPHGTMWFIRGYGASWTEPGGPKTQIAAARITRGTDTEGDAERSR